MNIILGKDLDGPSFSHLTAARCACGELVIGQLRLLSVLETVYGFPPVRENAIIRTAQYERALTEYDNGNRFYSASFSRDSFGVATHLLGARDEILMSAPSAFSLETLSACRNRLQTLARVERIAQDQGLDMGFAERLRRVIAEINKNRIPNPLATITLTDPATSWQKLWRELFGLLKDSGTEFKKFQPDRPVTSGDLSYAQASVSGTPPDKKPVPAGEGSVVHLVGHTLFEAADAAATLIKDLAEKEGPENIVVVREKYADLLDDALARQDLPLLGSSRETPGWAAVQVLPYLVSLLQEPVDPAPVRAFLLLPVNPLPKELKESLLDALCTIPSITSAKWEQVVKAYQSQATKEKRTGPAADLTRFILAGKRAQGDEVAVSLVADLCGKIAAWAREEEGKAEEETGFGACAEAAETLKQVMELKKGTTISLPWLKSLVSETVGAQAETGSRSRQALAVAGVTSPGAILRPVKHVIWWCATGSTVTVPPQPMWTGSELADLKKRKVILQDPKDEFLALSIRWRRAVQLAAGSLVLVSMENTGEEDEPHPIWYEILDGFINDEIKTGILTTSIQQFSAAEKPLKTPGTILLSRVKRLTWPGFKSEWETDPSLISMRDPASPSSLEQLVACPLHWVLSYIADINDPDHYSLPSGRQLVGDLVHDILETYLARIADRKWPSATQVEHDVRELFDRKAGDIAGIMDLAGWAGERAGARDQIVRAAVVLTNSLRQTGYTIRAREQWVRAGTEVGRVQGRTDLILEQAEGKGPRAILDIKSGGSTWYRQSLREGRAFQLAAYARLLKKPTEPWPVTGYFIVSTAELLTVHSPSILPDCITIDGPGEEATWQVLVDQVRKVTDKLKTGKIPLGIPEEDWKASEPEAVTPAKCGFCQYKLFCGWGRET